MSSPVPETVPRPVAARSKREQSAERQAKFQAKLRAMTPLGRLTRRKEENFYTSKEMEILAEFRVAADSLTQAAERLNAMLTTRLKAKITDTDATAEAREEAILCLAELRRQTSLFHPTF